jgi:DNA-cytosine methyltransferase
MGGLEDDYGDTSDSDIPKSSLRRSISTMLHADPVDSHRLSRQYPYPSADHTSDDGKDDERESDGENDSVQDEEEQDLWSAFGQNLHKFETDSNIRCLYPPSLHADWCPSIQPCDEYEVLKQMISAEAEDSSTTFHGEHKRYAQDLHEFQEFILRDFVVYVSVEGKDLPGHMQSLDVVATECQKSEFYMDGFLEQEGTRRYLHRILIRSVNIGYLQDQGRHSTKDQIYVQTEEGYKLGIDLNQDVWYRFERPAMEYSRLFADFLWVSDLLKHFVDYLTFKADLSQKVQLEDFRAKFIQQLYTWHSNDAVFQAWHWKCGSKSDLRQYIARHANFLNNQTWSLENKPGARLLRQPIWWQICPGNDFSSREGPRTREEQTVVTQNVRRAFCASFPDWDQKGFNLLKAIDAATSVENTRRKRIQERGFPDKFSVSGRYHTPDNIPLTADTLEKVGCAKSRPEINLLSVVGKVVVVQRDGLDENDPNFRCSYAFVRRAISHRRQKAISITWLVHPRETICGKAFYPHGNELFFSDECSCQPVLLSHVMAVFGISIFSDRAEAGATFFAQEKYSVDEMCFTTATKPDLECSCEVGGPAEQGISHKRSARTLLNASLPILSKEHILGVTKPLLVNEAVRPNLRNLSLFTGSGNFDRGLEESNVIQTTYAIECNEYGVQTSMANQRVKGRHRTESVNYCLQNWLRGVEQQPEIDILSAGFPCKGFSCLNNHKANKNGQRNCSLLASTLSYVELLLPRYVVLENVPGMNGGSPNACEQAICCLVGLGYQVLKTLLKACDFGAPQSRKRLFIIAASASLPFPRDPIGLGVGKRILTVADAIRRLPTIDNDTAINITNPDHIPLKRLQPKFGVVNLRTLVQKISTSPPAMNLYKTNQLGLLTRSETQWYLNQSDERRRKGSRSLTRVDPNKPFPTVVTQIQEMCSRSGAVLHPFEDRIMSLEEYKIAQGFLEDDVIIGPLSEQLKQVGNAVARPVGVAIGLVIAESWQAAHEQGIFVQLSVRQHDEDLQEGEEELESTGETPSLLAVHEGTPSYSVLRKEEGNGEHDLRTPAITIQDSDFNCDTLSQTSPKRSRLLTEFSVHNSPSAQLHAELLDADPDRGLWSSHSLSPTQTLAVRRKRIRNILDSDNDAPEEEQRAITSPAVRHHLSPAQSQAMRAKRIRIIPDSDDDDLSEYAITSPAVYGNMDGRRTRKRARNPSKHFASFSKTAEDPIVLSD